jgi:Domain of unknown function (DUF4145)
MSSPPAETFPFQCPQCSNAVLLEVLGRWQNFPDGDDAWKPRQWTAAMCTSCHSPIVLYQEVEPGPFENDWGTFTQEYPQADRQFPHSVPQGIRHEFAEAQRCMQGKNYTAGAMMARRVIEMITKDQDHRNRNLIGALKSMRDVGVIDARLYDWADAVRQVGNEGAHSTAPVSREDAEEVLLFVEALVDYLYVFRKRYAQFQARRQALREGKDPDALEAFVVDDLPEADEKPTEND